jgi:hypothetical protein
MRLSINQLLSPLEVGHEVDPAAKVHSLSFVNLSLLPTFGRTFWPVWRKKTASEEKITAL